MKNKNTVSVDISELESYVRSTNDKSPPNPITDWMSLKSQLQVNGLKSFRDALNKEPVASIDGIRAEYSTKLLSDLELLSKRHENNSEARNLPKFKKEFYDELSLPPAERSEEYREFVTKYSKLEASKHTIEAVSAKALLDLDKSELSLGNIKENLTKNLDTYKKEYGDQTLKDHNRAIIGFKDKDGVVRDVTIEEVRSSEKLGLTGEQREFILTSWQQGSFESGWLSGLASMRGDDGRSVFPSDSANRTQIFIDASDGVKIHNRVVTKLMDMTNPEDPKKVDYVEGATTVDITAMKADTFIPGCATSEPKIEIQLTNLAPDIAFNLPEGLKIQGVPDQLRLAEKIKSLGIEANLYAMVNGTPNAERAQGLLAHLVDKKEERDQLVAVYKTNEIFSSIGKIEDPLVRAEAIILQLEEDKSLSVNSQDPKSHQRAVELYCRAEKDPELRKQFAMEHLDGFLKEQKSTNLNDAMVGKMQEAVVSILTPICKNKNEVVALEKNAAKLVRQCAADVGKSMSWSQSWERFKDKVSDVVGSLVGHRNHSVKEIIAQHPKLKQTLEANLKKSARIIPPKASNTERGR
ncbi:MAG: hypothetical protein H0U78_02410 [Rickettsiaceae bacterium]|nr:hypothetical protein [Rickettsiaceae bacterium]